MENNTDKPVFNFDLPKGNSSIIKVIGVGGGGNNALKHMYERGIHGVDFVICNTDAQTLDNNPVANKVQLGLSTTEGLGAGADPEVGEKAAIESIDDIKAAMGQNTKMVFITAGMGGGTGTGAAPVVAKIAKEMGILTVGIVTVPFAFEGKRRLEQAEAGLEKLRNNVDSLIVINNDKLRQQFGNLGFKQGFSKADEVLTNAAKGMAEIITAPFPINIDFRDAKSVLQNSGTALMSTGIATGEKRAEEAVRKALDSPLLNDNKITGAKDVLLLILSGSDEANEVTMDEIGLINDYVQNEAGGNNNANIIFGVGTDEELGDAIKVLVIATGFAKEDKKNSGVTETIKYTLDEKSAAQRTSPFKTKQEDVAPIGTGEKNLFRLEDEEDTIAPVFKKTFPTQEQPRDIRFSDSSETEHTEENNGLFTFEEEGPDDFQAESFRFEVEEKPKQAPPTESFRTFTEEKPVEFNFSVTKPSSQEAPKPSTPENTFQATEAVREIPVAYEMPAVQIPPTKEEDSFTFINKTQDSEKSRERRNKLQEFNSRYQTNDEDFDFEKVPAFRRKNIIIEDQNASEQPVRSFLKDNNGTMEVRENRFLNKDVD